MEHPHEPKNDGETLARDKFRPQTTQPVFKHSPLDFDAPSIRLVRILPDLSSDGRIQLEIRHASTKSTYICLSYVWGKEKYLHRIRLAGRLFQIRQNLHDFLESARKKPHICSEWLWIDALCIDQSNNAERSHQVQQMGHIFSCAVKVISWLGDNRLIAQFLRESTKPLRLDTSAPMRIRSDTLAFFESDYWARAWITQEFALARLVTFMAGEEEIDRWQPPEEKEDDTILHQTVEPVYFESSSHRWRGRSLLSLLEIFSRKKCQHRYDKVFSLLGLCGEGSDLQVDYEISRDELANRVLQACSSSFCFCAVALLEEVLLKWAHFLADPSTAMVEKQSFGTLSLSTTLPRASGHIELKSMNKKIGHGNPLAVYINMHALCTSCSGRVVHVVILPGTCYRAQDTDNGFSIYHHECEIKEGKSKYVGFEEWDSRSHSLHGCSASYDRNAQTWDITFPFATLAKLAFMNALNGLCTRGIGATAASVGANDEPVLCMSSGSDLYIDAPDSSLPIPENTPQPSLESLRSFRVQPYVDDQGQTRYCGVFVYDRDDNKDVSQRSSPEESF
ncbi:unnamed protein product [Alternaria alternata]